MSKVIESTEYQQYKKQLAEFMQTINPKPTRDDIEKLKQRYMEKRAK